MRVHTIGRRQFITVLGGATAWPLAGHTEQPDRVRRVGVLISWPENNPTTQASVAAFGQALRELGWVEGGNIRIDYRFAKGDPALIKTYAAELVGLSPDVILASTTPGLSAVRQETRALPIVFVVVLDPVGQGFVQSLAQPGGNITGSAIPDAPIMGKWLQLFKEVAPRVTRVAVIFNPDTALAAALDNRAIEAAAPSLGMTVTLAPVHDDAGIEEAIAAQAREPGGGLIALPDPFNGAHRDATIAAASRTGLPLIGPSEFWPKTGALMSYWFHEADLFPQAAPYIDRILKGTSPADLPIQQPTKFLLVINLKTAKALGLTVPPSMLDRADEVIE